MSKVSQQTIKQLLTQEPAGEVIVWDDEIRGFGAKRNRAGSVSFVLNYRMRGKERRYIIGRHPEFTAAMAREEALALRVDIQNGHDPLEDRHQWRGEPTVRSTGRELSDRGRQAQTGEQRPRRAEHDEEARDSCTGRAPSDGEVKAAGCGPSELIASKRQTPIQANRVMAVLSAMFNFAIKAKLMTENPAKGIQEIQRTQTRTLALSRRASEVPARRWTAYRDQSAANALRVC